MSDVAAYDDAWEVTHSNWDTSIINSLNSGKLIAECPIDEENVTEETQDYYEAIKEASADLIGKAPEMYRMLSELSQSLAWEIENKYPPEMRAYPHNQAKYEADMQEVYEAWDLLRKARSGDND